jgi:hypothetical protein
MLARMTRQLIFLLLVYSTVFGVLWLSRAVLPHLNAVRLAQFR